MLVAHTYAGTRNLYNSSTAIRCALYSDTISCVHCYYSISGAWDEHALPFSWRWPEYRKKKKQTLLMVVNLPAHAHHTHTHHGVSHAHILTHILIDKDKKLFALHTNHVEKHNKLANDERCCRRFPFNGAQTIVLRSHRTNAWFVPFSIVYSPNRKTHYAFKFGANKQLSAGKRKAGGKKISTNWFEGKHMRRRFGWRVRMVCAQKHAPTDNKSVLISFQKERMKWKKKKNNACHCHTDTRTQQFGSQ